MSVDDPLLQRPAVVPTVNFTARWLSRVCLLGAGVLARRAVAELRERGYVYTVPQRGTFIVPPKARPAR
ncbi:MAG: hypothetical protein ACJ72W_16595 [Actinoallomurus sp.]